MTPDAGPTLASVAEDHLDDVYAYLVYLTGDRDLAEDLTAATFERALRRWRQFDPRRGAAKTWLCHIARSCALDHLRSEQRRRRRETAYVLGERSIEEGEVLSADLPPAFDDALRSLSASEREVIALRVLLGLDTRTTARLLRISPTACSTRLSRALRTLEEKVRSDVLA